ncbi:hypothetical protein EST38_g13867 [Candolleomyces aberdarensis]|uniref:Uncharacterized protein n=1 Tax=Candolleomyces aberdarensis TaxID=2316362 RepID=A0A4Q2CYR9_9AGAR|nr:hypothetical protein EST38_g13867 [Candolleomyces aberdarensis]
MMASYISSTVSGSGTGAEEASVTAAAATTSSFDFSGMMSSIGGSVSESFATVDLSSFSE